MANRFFFVRKCLRVFLIITQIAKQRFENFSPGTPINSRASHGRLREERGQNCERRQDNPQFQLKVKWEVWEKSYNAPIHLHKLLHVHCFQMPPDLQHCLMHFKQKESFNSIRTDLIVHLTTKSRLLQRFICQKRCF